MILGLHRAENGPFIAEVEVSITARCSLACAHCGFNVPRQPEPALGDDVLGELVDGLQQLSRLGVAIKSLAVLGGEPTLAPRLLERAVERFRAFDNVGRLEIVSNGLTPQGCTPRALQSIDRLSISVYCDDPTFAENWRSWLMRVAPHVELVLRDQSDGWAQWTGSAEVSEPQAQSMYERCWYRKHCVTLERGRVFVCSRIAKAARDEEGLRLNHDTTLAQLEDYLNSARALPSCRTCIPMMDLPQVPAGVQPDDRLVRLSKRAVGWLRRNCERSSAS